MSSDGKEIISFPRFILEMARSIISDDFYIFLFFIIALFTIYKALSVKKEIRDELEKMPDNPDWAKKLRRRLNIYYTSFLTIISVFPLLGMFGTVAALLNLDFSDLGGIAGNLDAVKNDFFRALTSTAWGIVFAVGFKLFNSRISFDMEDTLEDIDTVVRALKDREVRRERDIPAAESVPAPRPKTALLKLGEDTDND